MQTLLKSIKIFLKSISIIKATLYRPRFQGTKFNIIFGVYSKRTYQLWLGSLDQQILGFLKYLRNFASFLMVEVQVDCQHHLVF